MVSSDYQDTFILLSLLFIFTFLFRVLYLFFLKNLDLPLLPS